jgi:dihydroneopterin aldolase
VAAARPRKLIETLAEEIAQAILAGFAVKKVEVEIRKFILPDAEWVGVAIERKAVKRTEKRLRPVGGPLPVPKLPSAL